MWKESLRVGWVSVVVGVGCSGSASLVLKSPVSNQCAKAGLEGCEALSEGVLLYAEGKKDEGLPKLKEGAARNSPEKIQKFAELLTMVSSAPGVGKYSLALDDVVTTLTLEAGASELKTTRAEGEVKRTEAARPPYGLDSARGVVTADTDVAQIRHGLAASPADSPDWCSSAFGPGATCAVLIRGPLFLTDATPVSVECEGQFLAVMEGDLVQARFDAPVRMHGSRVLVPSGSMLVLGQLPEPEDTTSNPADTEGSVVLDEVSPAWSCPLYFSGFAPYRTERQPPREWAHEGGF